MSNPNVYEATARRILATLEEQDTQVNLAAAQVWATLAVVHELRTTNLLVAAAQEQGSVAWRKARGRLGLGDEADHG